MIGYILCEDAVLSRILERFPQQLTTANAKSGDLDKVISDMLENNKSFGCFIDFAGGQEDNRKPFAMPVWIWKIVGVFLIRMTNEDTIESEMRSVIDGLALLFRPDHTLGGLVPIAKMADIGDAETTEINGFPFYWLPFLVEVIDRTQGD